MTIKLRCVVLSSALFVMASAWACGNDSGDETSSSSKGTKAGAGGKGRGTAGSGAAGTAPAEPITEVECGSKTCKSMGSGPVASFLTPCCADEATGACGIAFPGATCEPAAESDSRCPSVDIMGFISIASCCSEENRCGIDASLLGMEGCVDLKEASALPVMGFITFPEPRTCDGVFDPIPEAEADADAGA